MIGEWLILVTIGVFVLEFAVKRLVDLYLYVKGRLNEKNKR